MIPDRREIYTVGYTDIAVRYMKRRHAQRDAAFFLPALKPGMRLLDCGCGPGSITAGLADAVSPGEVVGVDLEAGQIELARAQAREGGLEQVRFEVASAYQLPFPDASFDAVFSHALFEHLAEPEAGIEEIQRVLRPGGVVGLSSPNWSGNIMVPRQPEVERAVEVFKGIQQRNGGNPYIGLELGRLLEKAGFEHIRLTAMYDCYEDVPLVAELLAQQIEQGVGKQIVAGPGLDRAEVAALCEALRTWARHDGILFAQAFVDAVGYARR